MQDTINMPAQKKNIWAETSMQDTPVHKHAKHRSAQAGEACKHVNTSST